MEICSGSVQENDTWLSSHLLLTATFDFILLASSIRKKYKNIKILIYNLLLSRQYRDKLSGEFFAF